ncbi:MAG: type VI secretion system lipoprotein TssJ [Gammaproteobacteria bacterium]|nr:type VI secretion system lipoprotein TssJ [Gammaproteobacteria bacterium]
MTTVAVFGGSSKLGIRVAIAVGLLALGACASAPPPAPPPPVPADFSVTAGADINPDAGGRASPVVVRVYYLLGDSTYRNSDFDALYDRPDAALGKDLLGRYEQVLRPGQSVQLKVDVPVGTRAVGAVAAFRDIGNSHWRAQAVNGDTPLKSIKVTVDGRQVQIAVNTP